MSGQIDQPQNGDVVLGDSKAPATGVVLGGLEGVQQRLSSHHTDLQVAALGDALNYGRAGLDLLIQALRDDSLRVQKAAYLLLRDRPEPRIKKVLRTYQPYALFECLGTLQGHKQGVTAVALSPDQRTVISGSRDRTIKVWDWWAGEEIFTVNAGSLVYAISISADGDRFTIRGQQQQLKAWSLKTGQQIRPEPGHTGVLASVARSQDQQTLISGSQNMIKIWDLTSGREILTLQGHTSLVTSVAVSRDRQLIISGSEDQTVRIWGVA